MFLLAAIGSGILLLLSSRKGGLSSLTPQEAVRLSNTEHAQFIDIRAPEAFQESHIAQSKNFPKSTLESKASTLPKKPLILVCDTGRTAQEAAGILKKLNIENVYTLKDGLTAWKNEGLPLKSKKKSKE
ncbi:rhodanese-like domain-containing protein [Taylorella equigenitalis]|uniref:rhodanese-like domain-containing protein n=1 Tax=Taylorella equigenitalis TaxID=29575 RepID=UPI00237CE4CD|nr:rhodanese-like domain-containing protein [Taylorella equigenitalis]